MYYKFLCHWKILKIYSKKEKEVSGKTKKSIDWINKTIKENKWILRDAHFEEKFLCKKTIGEYLYDECRNAIAHVMPTYKLKPDSGASLMRVHIANSVIELLVDIFMKKELGLIYSIEDTGNYLFLKKKKEKAISVFESELKLGMGTS